MREELKLSLWIRLELRHSPTSTMSGDKVIKMESGRCFRVQEIQKAFLLENGYKSWVYEIREQRSFCSS
jgi:hypothetical protein